MHAECLRKYLVYNHILGVWGTTATIFVSTFPGIQESGSSFHVLDIIVINPGQPFFPAQHSERIDPRCCLHEELATVSIQIKQSNNLKKGCEIGWNHSKFAHRRIFLTYIRQSNFPFTKMSSPGFKTNQPVWGGNGGKEISLLFVQLKQTLDP